MSQRYAGTKKTYGVTLGKGDTFDIATLNIAGTSTSHTTSLDITGSLQTNALAYSGHRTDSLIKTVLAGGLFDIRNTLGATKAETLTVRGPRPVAFSSSAPPTPAASTLTIPT